MPIVNLVWHHGGRFVESPSLGYFDEVGCADSRDVDTDHFSYFELSWYVKNLGYADFNGIYYKGNYHDAVFIEMNDDALVKLANSLQEGDEVHFYVEHAISPALIVSDDVEVPPPPPGFFPDQPIVLDDDDNAVENLGDEGGEVEGDNAGEVEGENAGEEEGEDAGEEEGEPDGEEEGEDSGEEEGEDVAGEEGDEDFSEETEDSGNDDFDMTDNSEVDEELRQLREEKRQRRLKKVVHRKRAEQPVEVEMGEVGCDEGYENWGHDAHDYRGKIGGDEPYYGSESDYSIDSYDSDDERTELRRRRTKHVVYDPKSTYPIWEERMIFESVYQFREALAKYAVHVGVKLEIKPNEAKRVTTKCKHQGCKWRIHASFDGRSKNFMVKTYTPRHTCRRYNTNKLCNSKFLARYLESRVISQPGIKLWEIQDICRKELKLYVGITICRRAKNKILTKHMGDYKEEYARLHDYVDEINKSNPGSTCFLVVDKDSEPGKELFKRLYVCFNSLKQGWKQGCRKIIGLDACFLKGHVEGQLFVAIGKDGNGQMYPIAWEVTSSESTVTWTKFIRTLQEDLELGKGDGIVIMSDMHLGLISAVKKELPEAEHRFCARHIYANWAKKWRGSEKRMKFWNCCWSTFEVQLKENLDILGKLGEELVNDFLEYGKENFCKPYFKVDVNCDACENNMCETFNGWIRSARHKSIITMLEEIRRKVMERIVKMNAFAATWICDIAPMPLHRLERNKELAMQCDFLWNGDKGFEIQEGEYGHRVDLRALTCTCRSWQLKGISCAHAICAMSQLQLNPDDFVVHWHKKPTHLKAYAFPILPVMGMKMWPPSQHPPVEPPHVRIKRGRRKVNRRKSRDEPKKSSRYSRQGIAITCSVCSIQGHNKKTCPTRKQAASSQVASASSSQAPPHRNDAPPATRSNFPPDSSSQVPSQRNEAPTAARSSQVPPQTNEAARRSGSALRRQGVQASRSDSIPATTRQAAQTSRFEAHQGGGKRSGPDGVGPVTRNAKKGKLVGLGLYINPSNGMQILNPGTGASRILRCPKPLKSASEPVEIGQGRKLRWQGKSAVSRQQLQRPVTRSNTV